MSYAHNLMAYQAGERLLADLRGGNAAWANRHLTAQTSHWPGIIDWPKPDRIFEDDAGTTLAVEFKPPGHSKREYVTGLGQAMTYLRTFAYGAIVLPEHAIDGFRIAEYLKGVLDEQYASELPLALFTYGVDPAQLTPVVTLRNRVGSAPRLPGTTRRAFWAYVRDASYYDVYEILLEMDRRDLRFGAAYPNFWNAKRRTGRSLTLEGTQRRPKTHRFSDQNRGDRAERTNVYLLMRHTGLVDADGNVTEPGYELLRHGKVYTPHSESFLQMFGHRLLTVGRHLDLILWVERHQRQLPNAQKQSHEDFKHHLDEGMELAGFIRAAPQGRAKATFLRDEPKYWNRLGLLERDGRSYFHPGVGYVFNWRAIVGMVDQSE
jgi:hypothetical protein